MYLKNFRVFLAKVETACFFRFPSFLKNNFWSKCPIFMVNMPNFLVKMPNIVFQTFLQYQPSSFKSTTIVMCIDSKYALLDLYFIIYIVIYPLKFNSPFLPVLEHIWQLQTKEHNIKSLTMLVYLYIMSWEARNLKLKN